MGGAAVIVYRDGREDDVAFIVASWRACLLEGIDGKRGLDPTIFKRGISERIVRLLSRAQVRIACDDKADTTIIGYAVFEPTCGHFRYVRTSFRGLGIASKLVPEGMSVEVCTHRSQGHAPGKMRQVYNPFLLEER